MQKSLRVHWNDATGFGPANDYLAELTSGLTAGDDVDKRSSGYIIWTHMSLQLGWAVSGGYNANRSDLMRLLVVYDVNPGEGQPPYPSWNPEIWQARWIDQYDFTNIQKHGAVRPLTRDYQRNGAVLIDDTFAGDAYNGAQFKKYEVDVNLPASYLLNATDGGWRFMKYGSIWMSLYCWNGATQNYALHPFINMELWFRD